MSRLSTSGAMHRLVLEATLAVNFSPETSMIE